MTAGISPTQDLGRSSPVQPSQDAPTSYVTGLADGNLATPVRLKDYLVGVGVMFRLPKRNRKKEKAEAEAAEAAKFRIRIPVKKIAIALAPVAIAWLGYLAWDRFLATVPLPGEVAGTWSTNDGRYAGRNFWINQSSVAFQNGKTDDQFSIHPVKRIKAKHVADTLFLTVDYEQEGKPISLSLRFRDTPRPEIRLVNQPQIRWWRTGNAPVMSQ